MTAICFYFQVHQPRRLRRIRAFDAPPDLDYWDHENDHHILDRASAKSYLPTNAVLQDLIEQNDGWFRVSFSLSGVFLDIIEAHRPDVLQSFQDLVATGHVEILDETHHHSLAGLWDDPTEFRAQVEQHRETVDRLFGQRPRVFRNTELIYDDRVARTVSDLGYKGILTEGTERILGDRSPNHVYRTVHPGSDLKVLLKNYMLSDDIAFRFATPSWREFPLTADKYADWLAATPGDTINLFMDYETFGEHQWQETGIFDFLRHLPGHVAEHPHLGFALPSEVIRDHEPVDVFSAPHAISWADAERDVSAWLHNKMQHISFENLRELGALVHASGRPDALEAWRRLQTSDHLYYMATKTMGDQDIHQYFSPYESPYLAFINHANALDHLRNQVTKWVDERQRVAATATLDEDGGSATAADEQDVETTAAETRSVPRTRRSVDADAAKRRHERPAETR